MNAASLTPTQLAHHPAYEELFHFFSESRDLLCIADFQGMFKRLNPAWHALGWTLEELQSRPFLDFVHPDDHQATLDEMRNLEHGVTTVSFENRYRSKNGDYRWLQWTSTPRPELQEIYAIARDVDRQKQLEQEILQTLDRERERMGRELHDGICQDLASIGLFSNSLAQRLEIAQSEESQAASEISTLLTKAIQNVRQMARGFDPLRLELIGLVDALEDLCANTESVFRVACKLQCKETLSRLDTNTQAQLFRITQEAVHNAISHGKAARIKIGLSTENGRGTLNIQDNGIGLPATPEIHEGIGLHTMAYRARLISGTLEVVPHAPHGTAVVCQFPL